jgi:TRAP-type C4-dicarboxylate transport system substrate-binding protein
MMSNKPIATLDDLQGAKVWMPEGDPVSQAVFQKIGVSPVPLGIADVLLALQTRLVDVVYGPPLGAIALQWHTKVKYITRVPLAYALGAVIVTEKAFQRVPKNSRMVLKEVFTKNAALLSAQTRKQNEEALEVMAREGIESVMMEPQELTRIEEIVEEANREMAGKVFPAEILDEIGAYLTELRGSK